MYLKQFITNDALSKLICFKRLQEIFVKKILDLTFVGLYLFFPAQFFFRNKILLLLFFLTAVEIIAQEEILAQLQFVLQSLNQFVQKILRLRSLFQRLFQPSFWISTCFCVIILIQVAMFFEVASKVFSVSVLFSK